MPPEPGEGKKCHCRGCPGPIPPNLALLECQKQEENEEDKAPAGNRVVLHVRVRELGHEIWPEISRNHMGPPVGLKEEGPHRRRYEPGDEVDDDLRLAMLDDRLPVDEEDQEDAEDSDSEKHGSLLATNRMTVASSGCGLPFTCLASPGNIPPHPHPLSTSGEG